MKILHIVGARPNFMKAAPVMAAIDRRHARTQVLVHTGQHYDANMSEVFFDQLGLPKPDIDLEVGSGSHAYQTAQIMLRIEDVLLRHKPVLVLVYGDVNSTAAAAMVCSKLLIPIGHVEAGLRSFDRTMPEEINRLITDQLSDCLFTPSKDADYNLLREGISQEKIHFVGNVMIDTLIRLQAAADDENLMLQLKETIGFNQEEFFNGFGLVTLHRPSNVDNMEILARIVQTLGEISAEMPIIFPVHPRTRERIEEAGLTAFNNRELRLLDPIGYLQFLHLQKKAIVVMTDSGGIQEETTFLGVPCLTIRENTERPITIHQGTNILVGQDMKRLKAEVLKIKKGHSRKGKVPDLWDGKASDRIAEKILRNM